MKNKMEICSIILISNGPNKRKGLFWVSIQFCDKI